MRKREGRAGYRWDESKGELVWNRGVRGPRGIWSQWGLWWVGRVWSTVALVACLLVGPVVVLLCLLAVPALAVFRGDEG
jgi:hypothetical protein